MTGRDINQLQNEKGEQWEVVSVRSLPLNQLHQLDIKMTKIMLMSAVYAYGILSLTLYTVYNTYI